MTSVLGIVLGSAKDAVWEHRKPVVDVSVIPTRFLV